MHRRIHVAERELISRNLPARMHVPLAQQQNQLLFREMRIDFRECHHMERQIPRRIPRELPVVRHRHHVPVVQMRPPGVPALPPALRRFGLRRIPLQPLQHPEMIKLLRPQQAPVSLPRDLQLHRNLLVRVTESVKQIRLEQPFREYRPEVHLAPLPVRAQPKPQFRLPASRNRHPVISRRLRPRLRGIHRPPLPLNHIPVERVFHIRILIRNAIQPLRIRLVIREQPLSRRRHCLERKRPQRLVLAMHASGARLPDRRLRPVALSRPPPAPAIPEPHRRQHMQRPLLRTPIRNPHPNQQIVRRHLRVFRLHIEVTVPFERIRVQ